MGDAAGQPPDGLHFLSVAELVFEFLALRHVTKRHHRAQHLPLLITSGGADVLDRETCPILFPENFVGHMAYAAILKRHIDWTFLSSIRRFTGLCMRSNMVHAF